MKVESRTIAGRGKQAHSARVNCSNPNSKRTSTQVRHLHLNTNNEPHLDEGKLLKLLERFGADKLLNDSELHKTPLKKFIYKHLQASLEGLHTPIENSDQDKAILERYCKLVNQISAIAMRNLDDLMKQDQVLRILNDFYIDEVLHDSQKFFPIEETMKKQLDVSEQKFALLTGRVRNPVALDLNLTLDKFDFGANFEFLPRSDIKTASERSLKAVADVFSVVPITKTLLEVPTVYSVSDVLDYAAVTFPGSDLIFVCKEHLEETEEIFGREFSIDELVAHEKTHLMLHSLGFEPKTEDDPSYKSIANIHEFIANTVEMQVNPNPLQTFFYLIWSKIPDYYDLVSSRAKILADDFLYKNKGISLSDVMGKNFKPSDEKERAEQFKDFKNTFIKAIGEEGFQDLMNYVAKRFKIEAQQMLLDLYKQKALNTRDLESLVKRQSNSITVS